MEAKKEFRGKRLAALPVEDELYWGVMKYWYPELQLVSAETGAPQTVIELNSTPAPAAPQASAPPAVTGASVPKSDGPADKTGTVTLKPSRPTKPAKKTP